MIRTSTISGAAGTMGGAAKRIVAFPASGIGAVIHCTCTICQGDYKFARPPRAAPGPTNLAEGSIAVVWTGDGSAGDGSAGTWVCGDMGLEVADREC